MLSRLWIECFPCGASSSQSVIGACNGNKWNEERTARNVGVMIEGEGDMVGVEGRAEREGVG